jgi:hypothetical protein
MKRNHKADNDDDDTLSYRSKKSVKFRQSIETELILRRNPPELPQIFKQMNYNMKELWRAYLDEGNMIEEKSDE